MYTIELTKILPINVFYNKWVGCIIYGAKKWELNKLRKSLIFSCMSNLSNSILKSPMSEHNLSSLEILFNSCSIYWQLESAIEIQPEGVSINTMNYNVFLIRDNYFNKCWFTITRRIEIKIISSFLIWGIPDIKSCATMGGF